MSKLKEKELLKWLKENIDRYAFLQISHPHLGYIPTERDKQAYQQIEQMIKSQAEQEEIEVRYMEIILDLYDRLEKKKLEVTKEFVEGWKKHLMESGIKSAMQAEYNIRQMLKEAGGKVAKK